MMMTVFSFITNSTLKYLIVLLLIFSLFLFSCARVDVYPVQNKYGSQGKNLTASDPGIRFYRPSLYVWITKVAPSDKVNITKTEEKKKNKTTTETVSINGTTYNAQFVYLPDFTQEYVVQWNAGIGGVKPSFTLAEGWNLTTFNSEIDSGVPATIAAVSGAVKNIATLGAALVKPDDWDGPGLYKVEIDPDGKLSLGDIVLELNLPPVGP